jgi:hypothetical protein
MSFSGGLSQQPSYSFMPDFRGLSPTSEHVSMRLPRIRPLAWQPISLLARGLFLGPYSERGRTAVRPYIGFDHWFCRGVVHHARSHQEEGRNELRPYVGCGGIMV